MPRVTCVDEFCGVEHDSDFSVYAAVVVLAAIIIVAMLASNSSYLGDELLNNPVYLGY